MKILRGQQRFRGGKIRLREGAPCPLQKKARINAAVHLPDMNEHYACSLKLTLAIFVGFFLSVPLPYCYFHEPIMEIEADFAFNKEWPT